MENQQTEFKPDSKEDFDKFVAEADSTENWTLAYEDKNTKVFTRRADNSPINVVKLTTVLPDTDPNVLYDVLHDPEYRSTWDENMVEGYNIEQIDATNDVGYYSAKGFFTISGRDFVNQRAWKVNDEKEFIIKNHSVIHPKAPEKKGFVRAWSYMTGYIVRVRPEGGCSLVYLTQTDPRGEFSVASHDCAGSLPTMVVNYFTKTFAPKIVGKVQEATKKYPEWKASHNPENKPWRTGNYPSLTKS